MQTEMENKITNEWLNNMPGAQRITEKEAKWRPSRKHIPESHFWVVIYKKDSPSFWFMGKGIWNQPKSSDRVETRKFIDCDVALKYYARACRSFMSEDAVQMAVQSIRRRYVELYPDAMW